jgi:hypothetical protein
MSILVYPAFLRLSGRPVMVWVGIFYLAVVAILLDAMYRAPELDWCD